MPKSVALVLPVIFTLTAEATKHHTLVLRNSQPASSLWATASVPAHKLLAGTLAVALNEDVELLALVFSVLLGAYFGLQLYQFIESLYLHLLRHVVGQMF